MVSSPSGGMMSILRLQTTHATVKRMQSRPSAMMLASTGLRRLVGSELVEPGALSGSSTGRALVRNRIGNVPSFYSRFTRRRPPQCGRKELGRGPVMARTPRSSFRKGESDCCAEHRPPRPHVPRERAIRRNLADIRVLLGVQGQARTRDVPARKLSGEGPGRIDS